MERQEECIRCQGSGYLECDNCQGTGKVQEPIEPFKVIFRGLYKKNCPVCHGLRKVPCPTCKGTGVRIVKDLF